ncbi:MAG TPA: hypothetical protein PKL83_06915, partial [bacterium]|nr:hypothetical protein [bacterium]
SLVGSYFLDEAAGGIVFPIDQPDMPKPILQTMRLLTTDELKAKTKGCARETFDLSPLTAHRLTCSSAAANQSGSCVVSIDADTYLLYAQEGDETTDLCQTLKENYIQSVETRSY